MSTKTLRKRIALVAVAALAVTGLSTVPANAATLTDVTGAANNSGFALANVSTATITCTSAGTNITDGALKAVSPSGAEYFVGTNLTNAAMAPAPTLSTTSATFALAANFLNETGKWVFTCAAAGGGTPTYANSTQVGAALDSDSATSLWVYRTTPSYTGGTGRTVTSATAIAQTLNGVATLNIVSDDTSASYVVTSSGVGTMTSAFANNTGFASSSLTSNTGDTVTNNNGTNPAGGVTWTPNAARKSFIQVKASSAVAGSQTISVTPLNSSGTPGTPVTATITWGSTPVVAAGTTTAYLVAGTATSGSADATIIVAKAINTKAGNILITIKDQDGNDLNGVAVAATITGPGLVKVDCDTAFGDETGDARTSSDTCTSSQNKVTVGISSDGTSGAGVVTVTSGTTTLATKTVYFYDSPATVEAKQNHLILDAAGGAIGITPAANAGTGASIAQTPAVILTVKDKNGILIPNLTAASTSVTAVSSDTTVMSETISMAANDGSGAANTVAGTYNVQVSSVPKASGATATLKFRVVVSAALGTFVESAPLTYKLGGNVASVALSLDKAAYAVGEKAKVTLTLKDSAGNPARDADHANILSAALTSSLGITGSLSYNATATTVSSLGGVAVANVNAPATSGTWTVSGTTGTGPATAAEKAKALTASATVSSAVDAQITALVAAIAKLQAAINKINKRLKR